jgi:hypothetical protein
MTTLAEHGFGVAVGADPYDESSWRRFCEFVIEAGLCGVEVVLGPTVRNAEGFPDFFCVETADYGCSVLAESADRIVRDDLPVRWLFVDGEPSKRWMRSFLERLQGEGEGGGMASAIAWAAEEVDLEAHRRSCNLTKETVEHLGRAGFYVGITTVPFILDDAESSASSFELAMGIPVSGVRWTSISFQLYRSLYNGKDAGLAFGLPTGAFSPYLVYSYARSAANFFGERAGVGLGVAGSPAPVEGMGSGFYEDPRELADDVAAAKAAGIRRLRQLHLFWLEGMASTDSVGIGDWLETASVAPRDFPPDGATDNLRRLLASLGEILQSKLRGS